jgi:excisionase family DNA binding protein
MTVHHGRAATRRPINGDGVVLMPLLLTVEEAARLLSIGRPKMWRLAMSGEVLSVKIGGSRRIPKSAIEDYIRQLLDKASAMNVDAIPA